MGFNKLYLPEITDLQKSLDKDGKENFEGFWVRRYLKADAVIGSSESMDFIEQLMIKQDEKNSIASN
jgi:hypothetical protein